MIVYVESNFILELALEQKEAPVVDDILNFAENGTIDLAFPGFSLGETFTSIMHTQSERQGLRNRSDTILKQLRQSVQSELHKQVVSSLPPVLILLTELAARELELLHTAVERMLRSGRTIEVETSSFLQAVVYQNKFGMRPKDSIIYAAIIEDLKRHSVSEQKCFLSSDRKAFNDDPEIKAELTTYNCRYISSFSDGFRYIQRFISL